MRVFVICFLLASGQCFTSNFIKSPISKPFLPTSSLSKLQFKSDEKLSVSPITISKMDEGRENHSTFIEKKQSFKNQFAVLTGYLIAIGAFFQYLPIIRNILQAHSTRGLSLQTWLFHLVSLSAAIYYPWKKGFPVSTYLDAIVLWFQVLSIVGLTLFYQENFEWFCFGLAFTPFIGMVLSSIPIPPKYLGIFQVFASISSIYALIPQILINLESKSTMYSPITSGLATIGNILRVFSTLQLTKDKILLLSFSAGFFVNLILFCQTIFH